MVAIQAAKKHARAIAKMKILIVEDEKRASDYLSQGLTENGFSVETALNGTDGLHMAMNGDHDLVILDIMLPGIDGFAVLSALRTSKQIPVLMLTARGQTTDKVKGFELGADDYLVNLFSSRNCLPGCAHCSGVDRPRHQTTYCVSPILKLTRSSTAQRVAGSALNFPPRSLHC